MDQIRKLQLAQLYTMKKIAEICEENNICYYLCGGSLLGAIRHNGFIPWDDDLDITMYRKDLKRLANIIREKHSDEFFVQDFQSDKMYARYITKIRLNGTIQMEEDYVKSDIHQGIYIDIFPLDHVTQKSGIGLVLRGKLLRFLFAYKTVRCTKNKQTTKAKKFFMMVLRPFSYLIPQKFVNFLFDWICTATDKPGAKYTTSFASHYLWKRQLVENRIYGEGVLHKFENCMFRIPSGYTELLTQVFGPDYMQLPPVEKRNSGHMLVKIDLGKYEDEIINMVGMEMENV